MKDTLDTESQLSERHDNQLKENSKQPFRLLVFTFSALLFFLILFIFVSWFYFRQINIIQPKQIIIENSVTEPISITPEAVPTIQAYSELKVPYLWQPYFDSDAGFSIRIPHPFFEYKVETLATGESKLVLVSNPHVQMWDSPYLMEIVPIFVANQNTLEENILEFSPCQNINNANRYKLSNDALLFVEGHCGNSNNYLFTQNKDVFYMIIIQADKGFNNSRDIFKPILDTFTLFEHELDVFVDTQIGISFVYPEKSLMDTQRVEDSLRLNFAYLDQRVEVFVEPLPKNYFEMGGYEDRWGIMGEKNTMDCDLCTDDLVNTVYRHADSENFYYVRQLQNRSGKDLLNMILNSMLLDDRDAPLQVNVWSDLDCSNKGGGQCFGYKLKCEGLYCLCEPGSCL